MKLDKYSLKPIAAAILAFSLVGCGGIEDPTATDNSGSDNKEQNDGDNGQDWSKAGEEVTVDGVTYTSATGVAEMKTIISSTNAWFDDLQDLEQPMEAYGERMGEVMSDDHKMDMEALAMAMMGMAKTVELLEEKGEDGTFDIMDDLVTMLDQDEKDDMDEGVEDIIGSVERAGTTVTFNGVQMIFKVKHPETDVETQQTVTITNTMTLPDTGTSTSHSIEMANMSVTSGDITLAGDSGELTMKFETAFAVRDVEDEDDDIMPTEYDVSVPQATLSITNNPQGTATLTGSLDSEGFFKHFSGYTAYDMNGEEEFSPAVIDFSGSLVYNDETIAVDIVGEMTNAGTFDPFANIDISDYVPADPDQLATLTETNESGDRRYTVTLASSLLDAPPEMHDYHDYDDHGHDSHNENHDHNDHNGHDHSSHDDQHDGQDHSSHDDHNNGHDHYSANNDFIVQITEDSSVNETSYGQYSVQYQWDHQAHTKTYSKTFDHLMQSMNSRNYIDNHQLHYNYDEKDDEWREIRDGYVMLDGIDFTTVTTGSLNICFDAKGWEDNDSGCSGQLTNDAASFTTDGSSITITYQVDEDGDTVTYEYKDQIHSDFLSAVIAYEGKNHYYMRSQDFSLDFDYKLKADSNTLAMDIEHAYLELERHDDESDSNYRQFDVSGEITMDMVDASGQTLPQVSIAVDADRTDSYDGIAHLAIGYDGKELNIYTDQMFSEEEPTPSITFVTGDDKGWTIELNVDPDSSSESMGILKSGELEYGEVFGSDDGLYVKFEADGSEYDLITFEMDDN